MRFDIERGYWRWAITSLLVAGVVVLAGCGDDDEPDAYGNFEATQVTVSAEASGRLRRFEPRAGARLPEGAVVGYIDTVSVALQAGELRAGRQAAWARTVDAARQIDVLRVQLETAREEYERTQRLYDDDAATARQLNLRQGEVRTLEQQVEAARARANAAGDEIASFGARLAQVHQRLADSRIVNPVGGVVTTTYVERGEFVQPGRALYTVTDLDTLTLRAYVSGAQLTRVRLGQPVQVQYDVGADARASRRGVVTRVADEAEFTPTPVQTREERVDYVYAVEVAVPNTDGALKVGMPGELVFPDEETDE